MIKFGVVLLLLLLVGGQGVLGRRAFLSYLPDDHDLLMVRVLGQSLRDTNPEESTLFWYSSNVSLAARDLLQRDGWTRVDPPLDEWDLPEIVALGQKLNFSLLLFLYFDTLVLEDLEDLWSQLSGEPEAVAFGAVNSFLASYAYDDHVLLVNTTRTVDKDQWKKLPLKYNAESTQSYLYPEVWAQEKPISIIHYHHLWQPWQWWSFPLFYEGFQWTRVYETRLVEPKLRGTTTTILVFLYLIPVGLGLLSVMLWTNLPMGQGPFFFLHTLSPFVSTLMLLLIFTGSPVLLNLLLPPLGSPFWGWSLYGTWIVAGILIFFFPYYMWAYGHGKRQAKKLGNADNIRGTSKSDATLITFIATYVLAITTALVFHYCGTPSSNLFVRALVFFVYTSVVLAVLRYFASQLTIFVYRLGRTGGQK